MDYALRYGWDKQREGFYFAGPGLGPAYLQDQKLIVQKKVLWVQIGALKALLALHRVAPDEECYLQWFKTQWRYIQDELIDHSRRGSTRRVWRRCHDGEGGSQVWRQLPSRAKGALGKTVHMMAYRSFIAYHPLKTAGMRQAQWRAQADVRRYGAFRGARLKNSLRLQQTRS